jgi:hypothetical protein
MNPELSNAQIRSIIASVLWKTRKDPRPKWAEHTVITKRDLAYWGAQSILRGKYFDLTKS